MHDASSHHPTQRPSFMKDGVGIPVDAYRIDSYLSTLQLEVLCVYRP